MSATYPDASSAREWILADLLEELEHGPPGELVPGSRRLEPLPTRRRWPLYLWPALRRRPFTRTTPHRPTAHVG